jgi:hypothetical protein
MSGSSPTGSTSVVIAAKAVAASSDNVQTGIRVAAAGGWAQTVISPLNSIEE